MKKNMNGKKSHKVSEKLAHVAGRKWEELKPRQQKAKEELKKAADKLVDFGKELQTSFKEGVAEVQKRNKKR